MVNQFDKFMRRLDPKVRYRLRKALKNIYEDHLENLDCRPMKGSKGYFRVRIGNIRIIFKKTEQGNIIT